jgi:hypothetical protein
MIWKRNKAKTEHTAYVHGVGTYLVARAYPGSHNWTINLNGQAYMGMFTTPIEAMKTAQRDARRKLGGCPTEAY